MKVKLGDVCTIVSGTTPKTSIPEYWDGELNWITPAEINDDTVIITESKRKITEQGAKSCGLTAFPAGTVVLSSRAPIGKTAIAGVEMYCNQGFKNLICSDAIFNKYLFWFLRAKTDYLNSLGRGATFKEISKRIVEEIEIPLPPMEQQQHIASVLDRLSTLISLRKQQLAKLDELVKARFVEMFGDPVENSMGWETDTIKNVCSSILGGGTPSKKIPEYFDGTIPWVTPKDMKSIKITDSQDHITDDAIANSSTNLIPEDSVLMVIRSGILKHTLPVAVNAIPVTINQDMKAFIPDKRIATVFLLYYFILSEKSILSRIRGVTADNIDFNEFKSRSIILPPVKLQEEFGIFVFEVEKARDSIQRSLIRLETLKNALMQEYFG